MQTDSRGHWGTNVRQQLRRCRHEELQKYKGTRVWELRRPLSFLRGTGCPALCWEHEQGRMGPVLFVFLSILPKN
jgi:hypothetical protein